MAAKPQHSKTINRQFRRIYLLQQELCSQTTLTTALVDSPVTSIGVSSHVYQVRLPVTCNGSGNNTIRKPLVVCESHAI
jgi:hypothetical protein